MKNQLFTLVAPAIHGRTKDRQHMTIGLHCHRGNPKVETPTSVMVQIYLDIDTLLDLAKLLTEIQGLRLRDALDEARYFKEEIAKSFKSGATHPGDDDS